MTDNGEVRSRVKDLIDRVHLLAGQDGRALTPVARRHLQGLVAALGEPLGSEVLEAIAPLGLRLSQLSDEETAELATAVGRLRSIVEIRELVELSDDLVERCNEAVLAAESVLPRTARRSPGAPGSARTSRPAKLRAQAVAKIEDALSSVGVAEPTLHRREGRAQTYLTPGGQRIHLRTRSFDEAKQPFFSMSPSNLQDGDWFVFEAERRGSIVMPVAVLRDLADGIYLDHTGMYKPTFIIDAAECSIYVHGNHVDVSEWLNNFGALAQAEPRTPRD